MIMVYESARASRWLHKLQGIESIKGKLGL